MSFLLNRTEVNKVRKTLRVIMFQGAKFYLGRNFLFCVWVALQLDYFLLLVLCIFWLKQKSITLKHWINLFCSILSTKLSSSGTQAQSPVKYPVNRKNGVEKLNVPSPMVCYIICYFQILFKALCSIFCDQW